MNLGRIWLLAISCHWSILLVPSVWLSVRPPVSVQFSPSTFYTDPQTDVLGTMGNKAAYQRAGVPVSRPSVFHESWEHVRLPDAKVRYSIARWIFEKIKILQRSAQSCPSTVSSLINSSPLRSKLFASTPRRSSSSLSTQPIGMHRER